VKKKGIQHKSLGVTGSFMFTAYYEAPACVSAGMSACGHVDRCSMW